MTSDSGDTMASSSIAGTGVLSSDPSLTGTGGGGGGGSESPEPFEALGIPGIQGNGIGGPNDHPWDEQIGPWDRYSNIPTQDVGQYYGSFTHGRLPSKSDLHVLGDLPPISSSYSRKDQDYIYLSPWSRTYTNGTQNSNAWVSAGDLGFIATMNDARTWNPYFLNMGKATVGNLTIPPASEMEIDYLPRWVNSIGGYLPGDLRVTVWWKIGNGWNRFTYIGGYPTSRRWGMTDHCMARMATIAQVAHENGHTNAHNNNVSFWGTYNFIGGVNPSNFVNWSTTEPHYRTLHEQYPWVTPQTPWLTRDVVNGTSGPSSGLVNVDTRVRADINP